MATLSRGYTFGATETVTNTKLHNLVDLASITGIVNADVAPGAAIDSSKMSFNISDYVTIAGIQTISGAKTFSSSTSFQAINATNGQFSGQVSLNAGNPTNDEHAARKAYVDAQINSQFPLTIEKGGTGKTTQQEAIDALLPSQGSANGKFLTSNGSTSSWATLTQQRFVVTGVAKAPQNDDHILSVVVPFSGTAKNLYVARYGNTGNTFFTLQKNWVNTDLTTSAVTNSTGSDTTHTVSFSAGDVLSVIIFTSGSAPGFATATFEITS